MEHHQFPIAMKKQLATVILGVLSILSLTSGKATKLNSLSEEIAQLMVKMEEMEAAINEKSCDGETDATGEADAQFGSTYVRWGNSTCPTDKGTQLVYSGYAAGQSYNHEGGGVGPICLVGHEDIEYLQSQPGIQGLAIIYGAEYQTSPTGPLNHVDDRNVPCSVCYTANRPAVLMIPGKYTCPTGWNTEYYGYLMTGRYSASPDSYKSQSLYSCVDAGLEVIPGTGADNNGLFFFNVEIASHPSLCPPYDCSGEELTCVVCSK